VNVRPWFAFFLSFSMVSLAARPAFATFAPQFHPTLTIPKASTPITIDGDLSDAGWTNAARATGFAEVRPGDQTEPTVSSEAWITYDAKNLYVAFLAQDDPAEVRVSVCERDAIFRPLQYSRKKSPLLFDDQEPLPFCNPQLSQKMEKRH
jgi:hypothetical protein